MHNPFSASTTKIKNLHKLLFYMKTSSFKIKLALDFSGLRIKHHELI